ncbi:MAG: radical SAM protein [Planctomycetes bacterium]|nr:radical SAM protein [Planctomycetota bacterium]
MSNLHVTHHDRMAFNLLGNMRENVSSLKKLKRRLSDFGGAQVYEEIPVPGFCCFGITDTCMLKCNMCDKWKTDIFVEERLAPSVDQWKEAIRTLREIVPDGFEIDFGGGEALMYKGLMDCIRYATDLGFRTTLASNGWSVNKEMAKRIADAGLSSIIFSVDSLNPAVHDKFRGLEGVLDRVMRAIDNMSAASQDIHIGTCSIIMGATVEGIIDIAEWANAHERIKSALFMAVMQPNNTPLDDWWHSNDFEYLWPSPEQNVQLVLDELIKRRKAGYYIGNSVPQLQAFKQYFENPMAFVKSTKCNMDKAVHISAVGDVFLCFRKERVGNIRENANIAEYWRSDLAKKARKGVAECSDNCHFLLNCFFEADYPFEFDPAHLSQGLPGIGEKARPIPLSEVK